jgi:hypothetical protein
MNTGPLRGVCLFIYTPVGEATSVGSNRLHVGLRCILGGGVGVLQKLMEYGGRRARRAGVWPAGPTWRPLAAPLGLMSSGVFYTLLVYVSSWIILVIFDTLILFLLFSRINPVNL